MGSKIKEKTFIKFEGNIDNGIDILDLSESFIGYNKFIKSIFQAFYINTDNIEVKVTDVKKGSIIVDILFEYDWQNLFSNIQDFHDIIDLINIEFYQKFQRYLTENLDKNITNLKELYLEIEKFGRNYPVATMSIFTIFLGILRKSYKFIVSGKIKNKQIEHLPDDKQIIFEGENIKIRYLKRLKKTINQGKSKDLLGPIIDNKIETIKIGSEENIVNTENLDRFLGDGEKILPYLKNGSKYIFVGSFTAMQSNRGETMKLKSEYVIYNGNIEETKTKKGETFLFIVLLPHGKTTENYADYYGGSKQVKIEAEIIRDSEYKKPKMRLENIEIINQGGLFE